MLGDESHLKGQASHVSLATLSNCGDTLKLALPTWRRKAEKLQALKPLWAGESCTKGQGNDPGYGKNVLGMWAICSQVLHLCLKPTTNPLGVGECTGSKAE